MKRNVAVFAAFLSVMAGTASAQTVKDVRSVSISGLSPVTGFTAAGWRFCTK